MGSGRPKIKLTSIAERNRANALASTGPRTDDGKANSRHNALKFGLCANPAAGVVEDAGLFEQLHDQLVQRFEPQDTIEAALVHRIAVCLWRQQRAAMIDAAASELAIVAAAPMRKRVQDWIERINSLFQPLYVEEWDADKRPFGFPKDHKWYRVTRPGLATLDQMRDAFDGEIRVDAAAIEAMAAMLRSLREKLADARSIYCFMPMDAEVMAWLLGESATRLTPPEKQPVDYVRHAFPDACLWRSPIDELIGQARKNDYGDDRELPAELEAMIDLRLATYSAWQQTCKDQFSAEQAHRQRIAALLPDSPMLDRLIRYETHNDRSLARALETFARLRGATVESISARITARGGHGSTVEVVGQRTLWTSA